MTKPHISNTQLDMYWRCPEQYRRRYIEGERRPPGIALLVGGGMHKGAEVNFEQKIESREDLPPSEIVDAAVAGFETRVSADGFSCTDEEAGRGIKAVLGEAKDLTARLAAAHAFLQAPEYQPTEVEVATRILFPSATHDLLAITDLRDDKKRVVDLKTAAKRRPKNTAHRSTQLSIYAAAYQVDHGEPPSELRLDILTKGKESVRQVLETTRDIDDMRILASRINATLAAINAGSFPPCSPDSWICDPKWCGFWATCPYRMNPKPQGS